MATVKQMKTAYRFMGEAKLSGVKTWKYTDKSVIVYFNDGERAIYSYKKAEDPILRRALDRHMAAVLSGDAEKIASTCNYYRIMVEFITGAKQV
jgi:hypothetical protein